MIFVSVICHDQSDQCGYGEYPQDVMLLTPERRVLGRDVLHSGPGLGTRHRGRDVPPEVAYSCPHASRKKVPRGGSILGPCGHGAEELPDEPPSHVRKQIVWNFLYGQQILHEAIMQCYTAQSIVENHDIIPPGKSPDIPGKK